MHGLDLGQNESVIAELAADLLRRPAFLVTQSLVLRGEQPDAGEPGGGSRRHPLVEPAEPGTAEVRPDQVRPPQVARSSHHGETIIDLK